MEGLARVRPQAAVASVAKQFFPLPSVSAVVGEANVHANFERGSRSAERKSAQRSHVARWADDAINALNAMYLGTEFVADSSEAGASASLAQKRSVLRILSLVKSLGKPPTDVTGQGALSELRAKLGYDGQPSTLAQLQEGLVSLPVSGSQPAPLEKILGGSADFPCSLLESKVLPPEAVKGLKAQTSLKQPYFDPLLKFNRRAYASFVRKLHDSGVIEFRRSVREQCGLFCVWKKSGKQRLVVDARLTNLWFSDPEPVALATGTSFGNIEVDGHGPIQLAGVDIADAFYNIELPHQLRDLFGLRPLQACEAGVGWCERAALADHDKIFPVFRAVPMGWSHALWLCQYLHERVVEDVAGLGCHNRFVDGKIPPGLSPLIHTEYVDNFVAFSQQDGLAENAARKVGQLMAERGLPVHDVEAGNGGETLGWKFSEDKPEVVVTPRRLWKLRLATLELLKGGTASGHLLECILGHYTFVGLLCREFLSCFQACYAFCKRTYDTEIPMWPQVRRELMWACSLLPLVRRDLSSAWSGRVYATDASHWGRGVTVVEKPIDEVKSVARVNDRWKFGRGEEEKVKAVEDGTQFLPDCLTLEAPPPVLPVLEHAPLPSEAHGNSGDYVPLDFLSGDWKQLSNGPWERSESIPVLEGRAIVWVLQHLARSSKQHSMKHLILTDSMSCSLALSKGRSSMSSMNRICRQVGAVLLATGMRISCRWIPSELNPADGPSRGKPWRYFDAQAVAADWVEYAPTSKPVRTQGWRYEALQQVQRELRLRAEGDCRRSVEATHGQKPCVEAEQENGESQPTAETVQPQTRGHESSKRSYLSGEEVRHSGPGAFLPFGLAQAPSCIPSRQSLCAVDRGVGPSSHCPRECHVCGGPRPCRCPHSGGRHQVHATRCEENLRPDSHHTSFQGIRETGTVLGAGPHAVSLPGPGRAVPPRGGSSHGGSVGVAHMGRVFKARRNFEVTVEASHSSVPSPAEMDGNSQQPGCPRKCSAFEGGRKGRSRGDRSTILGLAGPGADETPPREGPKRGHLPVRHGARQHVVSQGPDGSQVCRCWPQFLLPNPSRKCKHRPVAEPSVSGRHHEERPVGNHEISAALRERRASGRGLRGLDKPTATRGHPGRKTDPLDVVSFSKGSPDSQCALEIFSGSGHFSKALRRQLPPKIEVVEIDLIHGPQFDLTKRSFQRFVLGLIKRGRVLMVWIGTPRSSWSRARRGGGYGPPPLRDNTFIWGLPDLSESDAHKAHVGNVLLKFSAAVFRLCIQLRIPVVLENPLTSMLWVSPPIRHLLQHRHVMHEYTDFCQEGCPYRKRTQLMFAFLDVRQCCRQCHSKRGACSFTGRPHEQLVGTRGGVFLTKLAEPYPPSLCKRLASSIGFSICATLSNSLNNLFNR